MNPGPLLFLATFFTMSISWLSFVLVPQLQIGRQVQVEADGVLYPSMRPGMARQGEQVYRANGCFYCHTEQVRPEGFGSDLARGWGGRTGKVQSVAQDYLYDQPVMLGSLRIGPDLANFAGVRRMKWFSCCIFTILGILSSACRSRSCRRINFCLRRASSGLLARRMRTRYRSRDWPPMRKSCPRTTPALWLPI